jgi:hypothetical protein
MSREDVEIVRATVETWNRGGRDAWMDAFDERAEWLPLRSQLEGGSYRGTWW